MPRSAPIITISDLYFAYNSSFSILIPKLTMYAGEIICITGPNGGGKTTYLECITGILQPQRGAITIEGEDINGALKAAKHHIGYVPDDENWFIKELCASEYLDVLMSVYWSAGVTAPMGERVTMLAQALRFTAFDIPIQQLSHGNKKKVQIIAALMHNPAVLVIDEIRNGLDPLAVLAVEDIIRAAAKAGACIIAASHDLWWAERLGSSVLIIDAGRPILSASVKDIKKKYGHVEDAFRALVS